jgi:hypothetical protein
VLQKGMGENAWHAPSHSTKRLLHCVTRDRGDGRQRCCGQGSALVPTNLIRVGLLLALVAARELKTEGLGSDVADDAGWPPAVLNATDLPGRADAERRLAVDQRGCRELDSTISGSGIETGRRASCCEERERADGVHELEEGEHLTCCWKGGGRLAAI